MTIPLEDEQKDLLAKFVEAHRKAPRDARGHFIVIESHSEPQATFLHSRAPGIQFEGALSDAEVLARFGLLQQGWSGRTQTFLVLPAAIELYEQMRCAAPATKVIEDEIRRYLDDQGFTRRHPTAFAQSEQAAALLWAADSARQYTTIGHLCREAIQAFAGSLAKACKVELAERDPTKTVKRLREIVAAQQRERIGEKEASFLDAVVGYWVTVLDLVQRQEHGAQREGKPLAWEDARRVVFQTLIVMFELDRAVRS